MAAVGAGCRPVSESTLAFAGALVLAGFHALTPILERLPGRHQAPLASLSGGAGLAYVTLYLLFELVRDGAEKIHGLLPLGPGPLETLFMLLLAALAITYTIHIELQKTVDTRDDHHGYGALFITYNLLVGAALVEEARWGELNLTFYVLALGLHMLFNDLYLHHMCPGAHSWRWRAALAAAPLTGWLLVALVALPMSVLYGVLVFVAGGTIINVLRFELPGVPTFRAAAFVTGIVLYAALIFATWRF